MTGEAEVLRPLVEACLHNNPVKRPSILTLSEKIKSLKVCLCLSCVCMHMRACTCVPSDKYIRADRIEQSRKYKFHYTNEILSAKFC